MGGAAVDEAAFSEEAGADMSRVRLRVDKEVAVSIGAIKVTQAAAVTMTALVEAAATEQVRVDETEITRR